ncbi:helicase-primase protein [Fadolivirus algeromassiliense]|jgi:phage/plasmid-associated DNA primase|uniref:Helicase-primase protein n=1 Tax=Fadolivirus FV1/VV64 TaxID=3070911 RepID=A0A7D3QTQ2_9VIRU|nr:helicase-primase protein [Fadolivirus algeromassiliense]QKF93507.1 helicase-primase protein [Fadolivirus FV1/VV64]
MSDINEFIKNYFMSLVNYDIDKQNELIKICKDIIQNTSDKPIIHFTGIGSNGKSVLVEVLKEIIQDIGGSNSIKVVDINNLKKYYQWLDKELKYVILTEFDNAMLNKNTGIFKELVSHDNIMVRKLHKNPELIKANLKFIIMSNGNINVQDAGLNNRIKTINMNAVFNQYNKDPTILNKIIQYKEEIKQFINTYNENKVMETIQNDDLDDNFEDDLNEYVMKISI